MPTHLDAQRQNYIEPFAPLLFAEAEAPASTKKVGLVGAWESEVFRMVRTNEFFAVLRNKNDKRLPLAKKPFP